MVDCRKCTSSMSPEVALLQSVSSVVQRTYRLFFGSTAKGVAEVSSLFLWLAHSTLKKVLVPCEQVIVQWLTSTTVRYFGLLRHTRSGYCEDVCTSPPIGPSLLVIKCGGLNFTEVAKNASTLGTTLISHLNAGGPQKGVNRRWGREIRGPKVSNSPSPQCNTQKPVGACVYV